MVDARSAVFRRVEPLRRNGMPDWRSNGLPTGVTFISPQVGINENSLDLVVDFTEGAIKPTRVTVRARKSSDGSEEHAQFDAAIARWTSNNPTIHGSIIGLQPAETWDVRWRISFDDGSLRDYVWKNLTTRSALSLPATNTLTPTYFLSNSGSDAAAGTSEGAAWATWQKVMLSAPSGAVVQVDDGYYESTADTGAGTNERNSTITIIAKYPSIGDDGADLANGHRVVVEPVNRTSPTGSGHTNAGVWTLVSVTGPGRYGLASTTYSLWKWAGSTIINPTFLTGTYRTGRADIPQRLHHHYRDADYLSTPGGFGEYIYTNQRHRYGFWADSNGDIYCRIPGAVDDTGTGVDPNTQYMTFSQIADAGISLKNGGASRVSGIAFYGFGRGAYNTRTLSVIDHCLIVSCFQPLRITGLDSYHLHNRILDSNMAADPPTFKTIDWSSVKSAGLMNDGTSYGSKICGASETTLFLSTSQRATIAHNYIEGTFNGIGGSGSQSSVQRYYAWGTNIHDNVFNLVADDCIEPEQASMCWKVWNNRIQKSISSLSTGPVHGGPVYFWFNEIWRNSAAYIGRRLDGGAGASGKVFSKFSSESEPQATIYFVHNTAVCDVTTVDGLGPIFAGDSAGGTTSSGAKVHEKHYWYGNVIYTNYRIMDEVNEQNAIEWYDDYNYYVTTDDTTPSGIKVGGVHYQNGSASLQMDDYRTNEGQGVNSNRVGATTYELNGATSEAWMAAQIPGFATGVLPLDAASDLIDIVPPCPMTARLGQSFYNAGATP
jgi:hypothetical protein